MSKALQVYWLVGVGWLAFLSFEALTGHESNPEPRQTLPGDVRSSFGGFRSFHFWHTGFSGGK